jgi:hypothetical protein
MIGDFFGVRVVQTQFVTVNQTVSTYTNIPGTGAVLAGTSTQTTTVPVQVLSVSGAREAIKIAEFESPIPMDRVYAAYNYYYNGGFKGGSVPATGPDLNAVAALVNNLQPGASLQVANTDAASVPRPHVELYRETVGMEKTLGNPDISVGLRLPILQQQGSGADFGDAVGDLSLFIKHAWVNDPMAGRTFSTGLVMTLPTGPDIMLPSGSVLKNDVLFQPWAGYFRSYSGFYIQGFHSVVIPTSERDTIFMSNDLAVGTFLLRRGADHWLSMIAPQLELHLTTPLNHNDPDGLVPNLLVGTAGLNFGLWGHSILTLGLGTPLTGPRPFDLETVCQMQWRF